MFIVVSFSLSEGRKENGYDLVLAYIWIKINYREDHVGNWILTMVVPTVIVSCLVLDAETMPGANDHSVSTESQADNSTNLWMAAKFKV